MYLDVTMQGGKWNLIARLLKEKIRPLFTKTKNPAITSEGRKNFHPVPLTRFDGSVLDDEMKPWKIKDVYATRVLSWIVSQYKVRGHQFLDPCDFSQLIRLSRPTKPIWKHTSLFWCRQS